MELSDTWTLVADSFWPLLAAGLTGTIPLALVSFAIGLALVGFGWSFGFIGSTVLLADAAPPARRARIVGRADLTAQLSSAAIAVSGGWWFASRGVSGLGVLAIAVAILPIAFFTRSSRYRVEPGKGTT